ncbi:MAG: hypothetical protein K0R17_4026 [Rariglobus sp.]|jgi:hypothetical protein|nr:hypothetical protein [Rariglobus sp.]
MASQADLAILSRRKGALIQTIRSRRAECADQLEQTLQPVLWAERLYAQWKAISPLVKIAAVPAGILLKKKLFPNAGGVVGGIFRWAPLAMNLFRSVR